MTEKDRFKEKRKYSFVKYLAKEAELRPVCTSHYPFARTGLICI